jgi:hypothetical protein
MPLAPKMSQTVKMLDAGAVKLNTDRKSLLDVVEVLLVLVV